MKKSLLSMAVVAVSVFTFGAMARDNNGKSCDKKFCDKKECCDKDAKCGKEGKRPCPNPFEGLNLTQEQQAKLKDMAPCGKKAIKQKQRETRDSIARAGRLDYLKGVKSVLTADQYVQFLENVFVSQPQRDPRMGHGPRHSKGKGCHASPKAEK